MTTQHEDNPVSQQPAAHYAHINNKNPEDTITRGPLIAWVPMTSSEGMLSDTEWEGPDRFEFPDGSSIRANFADRVCVGERVWLSPDTYPDNHGKYVAIDVIHMLGYEEKPYCVVILGASR